MLFIPFSGVEAKKIKQVHKIEKPSKNSGSAEDEPRRISAHDSCSLVLKDSTKLIIFADSVKFAGYDKPANASRETFHVINSSQGYIKKAGITINYLDLQDRMLHSRDVSVYCNTPAGETRLVSIPTWDVQHTFFYYLGPEPKRIATPYKVEITLQWIEV